MSNVTEGAMLKVMGLLDEILNDPQSAKKKLERINSTTTMIDLMGYLKARLAEIEKIEEAIRDKLIEAKFAKRDGLFYSAAVSTVEIENLDMNAVRANLTPQFIAKNTKRGTKTVLRVSARNHTAQRAA